VILYLDTSALLKLYVDEPGSDVTWAAASGSILATCRITWVEAVAALARREREAPAAGVVWRQARERLAQDWPALHVVDLTQSLAESAGDLAEAFALRGYDAVQLAAAKVLRGAAREGVSFACFDRRLSQAAKQLGFSLPPSLQA
jgi:predicted nucleic acid-binding protein